MCTAFACCCCSIISLSLSLCEYAIYRDGYLYIQATQRALLRSSSDSGFIARQVEAARKRFKELTVPELR